MVARIFSEIMLIDDLGWLINSELFFSFYWNTFWKVAGSHIYLASTNNKSILRNNRPLPSPTKYSWIRYWSKAIVTGMPANRSNHCPPEWPLFCKEYRLRLWRETISWPSSDRTIFILKITHNTCDKKSTPSHSSSNYSGLDNRPQCIHRRIWVGNVRPIHINFFITLLSFNNY